jgi:exosome complex component RRP4
MARRIVIPGELLAQNSTDFASGTFKENNTLYSKYFGILDQEGQKIKVWPLKGRYMPREGDIIIGEIVQILYSSWRVDINSPYDGILPLSEGVEEYVDLKEDYLGDFYNIGDIIMARIKKVSKNKDVQLTMRDKLARKLSGGLVVEIQYTKIPRVIGKIGSMISLLKDKTKCQIFAGQNGRVWVKGEKELMAAAAIKMIEREAHLSGLTEKIAAFLESK